MRIDIKLVHYVFLIAYIEWSTMALRRSLFALHYY